MFHTISGVQGVVRYGYHIAGALGAWTVTRSDGVVTLTAAVAQSNATRLSQRPLVFEAPHQHGTWCWPITELQITGASLTAVLGPKER